MEQRNRDRRRQNDRARSDRHRANRGQKDPPPCRPKPSSTLGGLVSENALNVPSTALGVGGNAAQDFLSPEDRRGEDSEEFVTYEWSDKESQLERGEAEEIAPSSECATEGRRATPASSKMRFGRASWKSSDAQLGGGDFSDFIETAVPGRSTTGAGACRGCSWLDGEPS